MNEYRDILATLGWRFLIALPFFALGASAVFGFYSFGLIFIGAVIVAKPLARLVAEPFGAIFFPNEHFDKPQPIFSIPEARRQEGKYEEAIEGFRSIVEEDPQELRGYVSMIDVAVVNLKDEARANDMLEWGLSRLSRREDRERLISAFQNIRSRLVSSRDGVGDVQPIPILKRGRGVSGGQGL